jgi:ABC-type glutathione transport system ATPase component
MRDQFANMEALLTTENLVKEYRSGHLNGAKGSVRALDQVSLAIPPGTRTAIVGSSGSGKSTLAICLACLEKPSSGAIRFQGRDLTALSESELRKVRPQIQLVFQEPAMAFNPFFTVQQIVEEPWVLQMEFDLTERHERAVKLVSRVGLSRDLLNRRSIDLSGGQRQRLAIARALALDPKILILDEAFSALDYSVQAQIANLLLDLSDRSIPTTVRPAILLITHDLVMAARIADEIIVMQNGRIVESGPTRKIIETPEHATTRTLLSAMTTASPKFEKGPAL